MAYAGPRGGGEGDRPGLPAPSVFTECLAPGPGLKSPHSSLLSTQQNKLFQGKVFPLQKMFSHALEALVLHVGSDQARQDLGPTLHSHSSQSLHPAES